MASDPIESTATHPAPEDPAFATLTPREQYLITYLREHEDNCPLCGYNLRGLTRPVCPECGRGIVLTVGLQDTFSYAWAVALIGQALSGGMGAFLLMMYCLGEGPPMHRPAERYACTMFLLALPVTGILLLVRRRFYRLPVGVQRLLALISWLLSASAFGALATIIR